MSSDPPIEPPRCSEIDQLEFEIARLKIELQVQTDQTDDYRATLQEFQGYDGDVGLWGVLIRDRDKAKSEIKRLKAINAAHLDLNTKQTQELQTDLKETIEMQASCFNQKSEMWWWIKGRRSTLELVLLRAGVEIEEAEE